MFNPIITDECLDVDTVEVGYIILVDGQDASEFDNTLPNSFLTEDGEIHTDCVTEAMEIAKSLTAYMSGGFDTDSIGEIYLKEHIGGDTYITETIVYTITYNKNTKRWTGVK